MKLPIRSGRNSRSRTSSWWWSCNTFFWFSFIFDRLFLASVRNHNPKTAFLVQEHFLRSCNSLLQILEHLIILNLISVFQNGFLQFLLFSGYTFFFRIFSNFYVSLIFLWVFHFWLIIFSCCNNIFLLSLLVSLLWCKLILIFCKFWFYLFSYVFRNNDYVPKKFQIFLLPIIAY